MAKTKLPPIAKLYLSAFIYDDKKAFKKYGAIIDFMNSLSAFDLIIKEYLD